MRDLRRLPNDIRGRAVGAIDGLADDPRPTSVKKLKTTANIFRIRIGDYRVRYQVDDEVHKVVVLAVKHRREIYRG